MIPHCILEDDLVLYALGDLDGERRKHLETHVRLCPECGQRIDQYRLLQRHLSRTFIANADSQLHRDTLKQRIVAEAANPQRAQVLSGKSLIWGWQAALALVLLVTVSIALTSTTDVEGRFPFADHVGLGPQNSTIDLESYIARAGELPGISIHENLEAGDSGLAVPDERHVPEELPLGLYHGQSYVRADGFVTHYYDSRDYGLEIAISISDPESTRTTIPEERSMLAEVNGTEVLVDRERAHIANGVLWLQDDLLFNVRIVRASGGLTLPPEQLMSVAEAVMLNRENGD